ncbi:hypothetical protein ACS0TY_034751 [Phlomoides rotata]
MGQKGYEEGFKYDHVWSTLKEYLQTQTETQGVVFSEPEENMMWSSNPSLPSFTVNLSDDSSDDSSPSQRPEGIKKSKIKRKLGEDMSTFLQTIKEENEKLWEILKSPNKNKARAFDILEREKEIRQQMSKHQLLTIDPNSIDDLDRRIIVHACEKLKTTNLLFQRALHNSAFAVK